MMRANLGFTLIEILVVLCIISIVTGVALVTISFNKHRALENFTRQLTQTILLAEERAMLLPASIGIRIEPDAVQFFMYQPALGEQPEQWVPISDGPLAKPLPLTDIELQFEQEDTRKKVADNAPAIVISSNGDLTPFKLWVASPGENPRYVVEGAADGSISSHAVE